MTKYTFEEDECRMCGKKTNKVVGIKFQAVAICEECCNSITKQNVYEQCSNNLKEEATEKST